MTYGVERVLGMRQLPCGAGDIKSNPDFLLAATRRGRMEGREMERRGKEMKREMETEMERERDRESEMGPSAYRVIIPVRPGKVRFSIPPLRSRSDISPATCTGFGKRTP